MERVNIAQIDIDVDSLIAKSAEVREKLINIGNEMKVLKDDFSKGNISIEEYTKRLTLLTAEQKGQRDELRVYDTLVKNHITTEAKQIASNTTMKGSIKELSAALSQNKHIYQQLSEEERNNAEVGGKLLAVIQEQDKKYKELQKSIGNNQVDVGNYRQAILDAVGDNQAFGTSMNSVVNTFNSLKVNIVALATPFTNFVQTGKMAPGVLNATATATGNVSTGMKILRGAIISTGIGALIVALGSLISYFTSTQEGVNKVNKVLTPLKVLFQTLFGVVQQVGKVLVEAFKAAWEPIKKVGEFIGTFLITPIKQVVGVVKGLGKILTGDFKGAWEEVKKPAQDLVNKGKEMGKAVGEARAKYAELGKEMKGIVGGIGDTMDEALKRGQRIEEINQRLAKSEAEHIEKTEALKELFAEQNQIARDTSKSVEEREKAAKASVETLKQINTLARERNQLEVERIELQQKSNDTSDEEKADLARKKAELNAANREMLNAETAQNKVINSIRNTARQEENARAKEQADKVRARMQEELKQQREAVEEYVKTNSAVAKSLQERLAIEEKGMQDRLAVLEKEKSKGLIKKNEYEKQKREIEESYLKTRTDLSIEAVKKEAEQYELQNKTKIDSETRLTAELIAQEQDRQEAIYQKKVKALEKEKQLKQEAHDWDYNAEDAYQQQLQELREGYNEKSRELKKQADEQEKEQRALNAELDFQERIARLESEGAGEYEIRYAQLENENALAIQKADEQHEAGQLSDEQYQRTLEGIRKDYAKKKIAIDKSVEEAKLMAFQSVFSQIKGLVGEQTALGKAAAIAETTINTYMAAQKAYSAMAGIPVVGPALGAVAAGAAVVSGMLNVKKIMETNVKYEKGGILKGKSHNEGGIPFTVAGRGGFEAEGGEYIVNKRATAMYFPVLEAINRSVSNGNYNPVYMQAGGVIKQLPEMKIDYTEITKAVREGAMQGTQTGAYEGAMQGAFQGSQQGAFEGARAGSLEGSMQGAYEGATMGTTSGLTDSILRISDNERARQSASI
nr:MAG TPA: tail length tape measure protein [Caudoviricetes sp.]